MQTWFTSPSPPVTKQPFRRRQHRPTKSSSIIFYTFPYDLVLRNNNDISKDNHQVFDHRPVNQEGKGKTRQWNQWLQVKRDEQHCTFLLTVALLDDIIRQVFYLATETVQNIIKSWILTLVSAFTCANWRLWCLEDTIQQQVFTIYHHHQQTSITTVCLYSPTAVCIVKRTVCTTVPPPPQQLQTWPAAHPLLLFKRFPYS